MPNRASKRRVNTKRNGQTNSRWSAHVTRTSHALELEKDVFKLPRAADVAQSLKISAEASHQRKAQPFQSAMSMLNFYINRAGKNISSQRRAVLQNAKQELRRLFGRA